MFVVVACELSFLGLKSTLVKVSAFGKRGAAKYGQIKVGDTSYSAEINEVNYVIKFTVTRLLCWVKTDSDLIVRTLFYCLQMR